MLSWIASDFFKSSPLLAYPITALAVFMTVFCVTALRAAFFSDKKKLEALAHLPFEGDSRHE
jgi:hypothetical protein